MNIEPSISKEYNECFAINCKQCPRLVEHLNSVKLAHADYYCKPVPGFGDSKPKLLIVGLAPGKHGANATGRVFTGDHAGLLLYQTLFDFGFSNKATSTNLDDGLTLYNCKITNAVKCLPPDNKPISDEVNRCNHYLRNEILNLKQSSVVLSLGVLSHKAVIKALQLKQKDYQFKHNNHYKLPSGLTLIDSYHCSRYNTNTGRLTTAMFNEVFQNIVLLINEK